MKITRVAGLRVSKEGTQFTLKIKRDEECGTQALDRKWRRFFEST